jgi:hypothetical protein
LRANAQAGTSHPFGANLRSPGSMSELRLASYARATA